MQDAACWATRAPLMKLSWNDLVVDGVTPEEAQQWLSDWSFLGLGRVAPICLSRFGDWFMLRPDGAVDRIDVLEFRIDRVAPSMEAFEAQMNDPGWQHESLLSWLVAELHEAGVVARERRCYGFAPPPAFSGRISRNDVLVLDMLVWQTICAQTWQQIGPNPSR